MVVLKDHLWGPPVMVWAQECNPMVGPLAIGRGRPTYECTALHANVMMGFTCE